MASNPMSIRFLLNSPSADPPGPPPPSAAAPRVASGKSKAAVAEAPPLPVDETADMSIARSLQASLNRNPSRRSKQQTTSLRDPSSDTDLSSDDEDIPADGKAYAIDDFIAVDDVTGHVLVRFVAGSDRQWLPYVYLRWACPTLRCKAELVDKVKALLPKPIKSKYQRLDRPSIADFHPIVPIHYIPRLDDGTREGAHERLVYRLQGRHIMGVALLEAVRKSYAASAPEKLRALNQFVRAKKDEIVQAGKNQPRLLELMGLLLQHHDLMQPRTAYAFTNFRFLIGKPSPAAAEKKQKRSSSSMGEETTREPPAAKKKPRGEERHELDDAARLIETARTLMGMKQRALTQQQQPSASRGEELTFVELVIPSPRTLSDDEDDGRSAAATKKR